MSLGAVLQERHSEIDDIVHLAIETYAFMPSTEEAAAVILYLRLKIEPLLAPYLAENAKTPAESVEDPIPRLAHILEFPDCDNPRHG